MEDVFTRDIYTIQIHRTTNVENRSPDCEVCKNGVVHLTSLQVRQFSQSGKLPGVCKVCNKEFLKVCRMQIRHLTQPEAQLHVCNICQKTFIHAGNLRKHKQQHENASDGKEAVQGPVRFVNMIRMKSDPENPDSPQQASVSLDSEKSEPATEFEKNVCFCKLCSKQFKDEYCFTKHCQVHSEKQNFYCGVCKQSFDSKSTLRAHNRDEHEMKQQFVCNICFLVYNDVVVLKDHCLQLHNNVANGQISSSKDILGRPIFRCEVCNKHFIQKVAYERHCQVHTGDSPLYTCKVCQKNYIQPGRLKLHQRLHKKTKFFSCNVCNKTFQKKAAFKTHVQTHCNETDSIEP